MPSQSAKRALFAILVCACSDATAIDVQKVLATVTVEVAAPQLGVGQTTQASVKLADASKSPFSLGPTDSVKWATSNPALATVSSSGLVKAVSVGTVTITASALTKSGSASLTVGATPGHEVFSVSRDVGSTAGGVAVRISGRGFATGDLVTFGPTQATNVAFVNGTTISATVPAGLEGVVDVGITHNGATSTLAKGFEYLPAPTTTYFKSDFENGSLDPFFVDGGTGTVSSDFAFSGTKSYKGFRTGTGNAGLSYIFASPVNPALTEPNGVYMRWYIYAPSSTVSNAQAAGGQIKMLLFRTTAGSGQPGYLMCGLGSSFRGPPFTCFVDNGIFNIPGGLTPFSLGDGVWLEVETWNKRKDGLGRARMWINGKNTFDYSHAAMGSDIPTDRYWVRLGLTYTQSPIGPVAVYVDNVAGANGFIDP